jgi:hypothetical protein
MELLPSGTAHLLPQLTEKVKKYDSVRQTGGHSMIVFAVMSSAYRCDDGFFRHKAAATFLTDLHSL